MTAVGLVVVAVSVVTYVLGSLTIARRTRLAGGHWSDPETAAAGIFRAGYQAPGCSLMQG